VAYETDAGLDKALKHWAKISRAGQHSPSLADFCQQEASLQYDRFSNLNLDSAFVILRKHLGAKYFDTKGSDIISQLQTSASLLLFIWSCLNLERYTRTANCFDLFKDSELFNSLDLKQIQLSNGLDIGEVNLTEPQIQNMSFLTQSLSAVELNAADLSQLNFTIGHMQAFKCDASSFALTHWSHVKISESIFQKSIFQQTIIHGCRWLNTAFSASLFQNVKFQLTYFFDCELIDSVFTQCHFTDVEFRSTHMQGVIFDRCTFVRCSFKTPQHINLDENITFRHSTFLEMSEVLEEGAVHHFEQCIFPEPSINKADMKSERFLNTQVGGLLS